MLDLLKSDVYLDEQYFDVIDSKTENGTRKVPIADKVLPFFKAWYDDTDSEYLLHTENGEQFKYRNYYDSYFIPLMVNLGFDLYINACRSKSFPNHNQKNCRTFRCYDAHRKSLYSFRC